MRRFSTRKIRRLAEKRGGAPLQLAEKLDAIYAGKPPHPSYKQLEAYWREAFPLQCEMTRNVTGCRMPQEGFDDHEEEIYTVLRELSGQNASLANDIVHAYPQTTEYLKRVRALNRRFNKKKLCHFTATRPTQFVCHCDERNDSS